MSSTTSTPEHDNRVPEKLMEESATYRVSSSRHRPVKPLDDPDFIGAEAALKRAAAKAIARDLAAGLEPIVRSRPDMQTPTRP